ncbi:MAG: outer membrane beta-barrel protein [Rhizobiaceae bacterium]|nr:outer membrane beta-barrel protein [Rhizobiaceae bacterium]
MGSRVVVGLFSRKDVAMSSTKKLMAMVPAAMLAAAVVHTGTATAADLLIDPPVVEAPEIVTYASGGWYLRGDITYDFHEIDGAHYSNGWGNTSFATTEADDSFDLGIGIGYQINENFRVDLTGEYVFEADFNGTTQGYCDYGAFLAGDLNCSSVDSSSFDAFKLLGNAYVDLGNFSDFTPYVGAGLGGAYVRWDDTTSENTCTFSGIVACPGGIPATTTTTATQGGTESWRFAWALHAGFSYDVAHNTKLDFGYTYSRIEGGDMFEWAGAGGTQGYDEGIDSHVIRAGIRYQIW